MRIYIVRHGKAADEGYNFDEDRPLTDEGRALMRVTAKAWVKLGDAKPEVWLSSPLVRAVQTCEICVDALTLWSAMQDSSVRHRASGPMALQAAARTQSSSARRFAASSCSTRAPVTRTPEVDPLVTVVVLELSARCPQPAAIVAEVTRASAANEVRTMIFAPEVP